MVFDHQGEYPSQWKAIESIAAKLAINHETLRQWVRRAETDAGERPGLTTDERARMKELERENFELRRANEMADSTSQRNESCEMSESRSWEDVCKDIMATSALNRRSWPSGSERRVGDLSTSPRRSAARAPWSGSWCAMAGTSKLTHSAGSRDRVA
jgi:transposase